MLARLAMHESWATHLLVTNEMIVVALFCGALLSFRERLGHGCACSLAGRHRALAVELGAIEIGVLALGPHEAPLLCLIALLLTTHVCRGDQRPRQFGARLLGENADLACHLAPLGKLLRARVSDGAGPDVKAASIALCFGEGASL